MSRPSLRRVSFYYLPFACNLGLIAYLVWQMKYASYYDRHSDLLMFSIMYALGGAVLVISAVTAFFHGSTPAGGTRWHYALALVNTIIPTVLLVIVLRSG